MRAVAPSDTTTKYIYLSVILFLVRDGLVMALIMVFPVITPGVLGTDAPILAAFYPLARGSKRPISALA